MLNLAKTIFGILLVVSLALPQVGHGFGEKDVELAGSFEQGGLILGKRLEGTNVWFNQKPISVTPQGEFVFGFGRDAQLSHSLRLQREGIEFTIPVSIKKRDYKIQRVDGVPQKTVDPPAPEVLKRIRAETALVKEARKRKEILNYFSQPENF